MTIRNASIIRVFLPIVLFLSFLVGINSGNLKAQQAAALSPLAQRTSLPSYSSRLWQTGDDSERSVVQAVAQTSDGILWIGTAGGLARFDGQEFEFIPAGDIPQLAKQKVNVLCADAHGKLWVGTAGEGLFSLEDETWEHFPLKDSDPHVVALHATDDGSVWIGTRKRVAVVKQGQISLRTTDNDVVPGPEELPYTETVRSIAQDPAGHLWIGAGNHLMSLNQTGAVLASFDLARYLSTYTRSICYRRDGSIWIGANSGLLRFQHGKFTQFTKANGLPDHVVTAVYEDSRGSLWIGTSAGLCRFYEDKFVVETTSDGEVYDQILCLFEDREKNVWVGAKNGLYQLRIQQFTTYTTRHGLAHNNIISACEETDGTLWIGTWGGGLHQVRDGKITNYTSANTPAMRNDLVLAMQPATEGGIWFSGDYDNGTFRVKDGKFTRYYWEEGDQSLAARALLEESPNRLLLGTALRSILVIQDGHFANYAPGKLPRNIRCLLKASDGQLWIGTESGLICQSNQTFQTFTTDHGLWDNFIHTIHEDTEQSIWIGTRQGLQQIKDGKIRTHEITPAFPSGGVLEIMQDNGRNLWLATRQGIYRVDRKHLEQAANDGAGVITATVFGREDGMLSPVCVAVAKPSAIKTRDGHLWFATTKGLVVTDPQLSIGRNEQPPPVVILNILADKTNVISRKWLHNSPDEPKTVSTAQPINIAPGNGELEFRYAALSYSSPEKNRFRYKLIGFDDDWVDAGTRRSAFYNTVPPGSYEFRVIASNNDGVWNEAGSSVNLVLAPHYWQTAWFRGLAAILAFCCVAGSGRFITWKRMRNKMQMLQQEHAIERERSRIAQDMHDELGVRLSEILLLSNMADNESRTTECKELNRKISHAAREVVGNLDAIVWAVNPKNDSLETFVNYLHEYVPDYLKLSQIRCLFDVPLHLPSQPLASEVRHNLFLVVKEALHNIVKHAEATEVRISISISNDVLRLTITDNGRGFANQTNPGFGNGLSNMKKRMTTIGGEFQIQSQISGGTSIDLRIKTGECKLQARSEALPTSTITHIETR